MNPKSDFFVECDSKGDWFAFNENGSIMSHACPSKVHAINVGIELFWKSQPTNFLSIVTPLVCRDKCKDLD